MKDLDKAWAAFGKAIRTNATEKQVNGIVARIHRLSARRS